MDKVAMGQNFLRVCHFSPAGLHFASEMCSRLD
jgi:hypothetical protein